MTAFYGIFIGMILQLKFAPDSAMGRLLNRFLVENPIAMMSKFRPHHLLYVAILIPLMMAGGDIIAIMGPEVVATYALDLAIYFDAIAVTLALSAGAGVRSGFALLANAGRRLLRRPEVSRKKRSQTTRPVDRTPSNDDDDPVRLALAA